MLEQRFLDMLCCPACRGELEVVSETEFRCPSCNFDYPVVDDIPILFPRNVKQEMGELFTREWDPEHRATYYDENVEGEGDIFGTFQNESELMGIKRLYDVDKLGIVMDAGCGNGRFLSELPAETVKVGVDASLNLLQATQRRERADFLVCCELEHLPFNDSCFDTVINCRVLQHLVDQDAAVHEMCRVARARGDVIIEVYNRWNLKALYKTIRMAGWGRVLDVPFGLVRKSWKPFGPWGMDYDRYNSWRELSGWLRGGGMRSIEGSGVGFGYHKYLLLAFMIHQVLARFAPSLLKLHYTLCLALERAIGPYFPFKYLLEKFVIKGTK